MKLNKYLLMTFATIGLLSISANRSNAGEIASLGSSLSSVASAVTDLADSIAGTMSDLTCEMYEESTLLTGYGKGKALDAMDSLVGGTYNEQIMMELSLLMPSYTQCINVKRGNDLRAAMANAEAKSYERIYNSWLERKENSETRGNEFTEVEPTLDTTKGWIGKQEMWVNQPSWGSSLLTTVVNDQVQDLAASVSDDPATQGLIEDILAVN